MVKAIGQQFKLQWKGWLTGYLSILIVCIIGDFLLLYILRPELTDETYFPMGSLMGIIVLGVFGVIMIMAQMNVGFQMAISMGRTRKIFFTAFHLVSLAGMMIGVLIIAIYGQIEKIVCQNMFKGWESEINLIPYLKSYSVLAAVSLVIIFGFCSVLMIQFGKKVFWILWAIWVFGSMVLPRVLEISKNAPGSIWGRLGNKITYLLGSFTVNMLVVGAVVLCIVCLAGTCIIGRKLQVTV